MTVRANGRLDVLRRILQDRLEEQTSELAELTASATDPGHIGRDPQTVTALIASSRRSIADTGSALERMAEQTYGRCERCGLDIPLERLEILPHARFCVPCQQRHGR